MSGLHDLIPGLREAELQDQEQQLEAFAGVEPDIAGVVEVLPFTPQMFLELSGCGNAFFGGENSRIRLEDIAQFLWRVSAKFSRSDRELRQLFHAGLALSVNYEDAAAGIIAYVRRAWQGMPQWPSGGRASAGVWPSRLVHMFAREYGWQEEYILNLPYRRLWQYANRVLEDSDSEYVQRSREAMRLRDEWLKTQNAEPAGRN